MKPNHVLRGVLAMIGSSVMFAVMAGLIRAASHIDPYRMSFFRFAVGLAVLGTLVLANRIELRGRRPLLLLGRGMFGTAAVLSSANRSAGAAGSASFLSLPAAWPSP